MNTNESKRHGPKVKEAESTYMGKKNIPKLVYICSRYSGDTVGNATKAVRYSRFAVNEGVVPIAPHLLLPLYMDEATERAKAMEMDLVILGRCDELWVFGREWSEGMKAEIEVASRLGMKIRRFTEECREVQIDE